MKKMYIGTLWKKDKENFKEILKKSHEVGYFGIDSAYICMNEKMVGEILQELKEDGLNFKIQTKIWPKHFKEVENTYAQMLEELQVDKTYSLLLHRPSINFTDTVQAWKALIKMKEENKVEHIGVSNFDKDMIEILIKRTGVKPEFNQIEMSLTNFRDDRLFYNNKMGIEIQAWSPLGKDPQKIINNEYVIELAKKYSVTPGNIAISFLTSQNIVPIIGTSKVERILENSNTVILSSEEIENLKKMNIYENKFQETYYF